jgi:hypothetical protein
MKEKIDTFEFHLSLRIQHFFVNFAFKFGQESEHTSPQIETYNSEALSRLAHVSNSRDRREFSCVLIG